MTGDPRWYGRAGAWLEIGTSAAGLLFGASLAARHDGQVPLPNVLLAVGVAAALLYAQGALGLRPPLGDGATLPDLTPRYLARGGAVALNAALTAGMTGWFGFNTGLGGTALAALVGAPPALGSLVLGAAILAVSLAGMVRWNVVAIITTLSALALVGVVVAAVGDPAVPVRLRPGSLDTLLVDISAAVGFVAVFAVRAPDFTVGLHRRADLAALVAVLIVPMLLVAGAGVALHRAIGSAQLVQWLAQSDNLAAANLLVALAVVAPSFSAMYSGSLALQSVTPLNARQAMLAIALPGLVLGILRFDRLLPLWLTVLGAALPPVVVPMVVEARARRRGRAPRRVPLWSWLPASVLAVGLDVAGQHSAAVLGLALAAALTTVWRRQDARSAAAAAATRP